MDWIMEKSWNKNRALRLGPERRDILVGEIISGSSKDYIVHERFRTLIFVLTIYALGMIPTFLFFFDRIKPGEMNLISTLGNSMFWPLFLLIILVDPPRRDVNNR